MATRTPSNAAEICNRVVTVAQRNTPLVQAAQQMRTDHVGCVVVVEPAPVGRRVVGMLTDRDIVTAVVAKGVDPHKIAVEDVMSRDIVTVAEDESVTGVLRKMRRRGLRRLPVVGTDGALVGIVTLDDMLSLLAAQMRDLAQAVESEQRREGETRA
jgi:CBS domain-containing protein